MVLAAVGGTAALLAEIGVLLVGLALLARLADRLRFSPIPLYLIAGLTLGQLGGDPLSFSRDVVEIGAEIGLVLLLFMLGLEFTGEELTSSLRTSIRPGALDLVLNMTPGVAAGLLLGWEFTAALLLGGVTYISSSGIIAKLISDLGRLGNRETPAVLSLLVIEDLAMAMYLPLVAVLLGGTALGAGIALVALGVAAAVAAIAIASRYGQVIGGFLHSRSSEVLLLTVLGVALLVAAGAETLQLSAPVGAFLAGLVVSGPIAEEAREVLSPLRDLFAVVFFVFFGLQVDVSAIGPVLPAAIAISVVTAATKLGTGWFAAARIGAGPRARARAGTALVARGEFSIVVAGLAVGTGVEPDLAPLTAAYVLITAIAAPLMTRWGPDVLPRPRPAAAT